MLIETFCQKRSSQHSGFTNAGRVSDLPVCSKKQSWVIARDSGLQDQISTHELTPASHSSEVYFHTAETFQSIVPVCTPLHLSICVCVMCVCTHANQRLTLRYFSPLDSLRQGLSLDLELAGFTALQSATPWLPNLSWVLRVWTPTIMLAQQTLYPL